MGGYKIWFDSTESKIHIFHCGLKVYNGMEREWNALEWNAIEWNGTGIERNRKEWNENRMEGEWNAIQ